MAVPEASLSLSRIDAGAQSRHNREEGIELLLGHQKVQKCRITQVSGVLGYDGVCVSVGVREVRGGSLVEGVKVALFLAWPIAKV